MANPQRIPAKPNAFDNVCSTTILSYSVTSDVAEGVVLKSM